MIAEEREMTPDERTATVPEPLWKGKPLPARGRTVTVRWLERTTTRPTAYRTRTVTFTMRDGFGAFLKEGSRSDFGVLLLLDVPGCQTITLDARCLIDRWEYVDLPGQGEIAADVEEPDTADVTELPTVTTAAGEVVADPAGRTINAKVLRLIDLYDRIKAAKAEIKGCEAEFAALEADVLEQWSGDDQRNITLAGRTVYQASAAHVEKHPNVTTGDIREALVASGLGDMVSETYSGASLTAYLRELNDNDCDVPAPLAEVVTLVRVPRIRFRVAPSRIRAPRI